MTEFEPDDDFFDDLPENVEPVGGPRRLLVVFGAALAAFVFVGVAGAALLFFLVLRVRDHTDPNHAVRDKYANRYTACVRAGGTAGSCSASVLTACERDGWWRQPSRTPQRETVCLATVPSQS
jgi:hypothetical protein